MGPCKVASNVLLLGVNVWGVFVYVTGGEGVLWGSAVYLYTSIGVGVGVVCYQLPLMTVGAVAITERFMYIYSLEQYLQSTTQSAGYTRLSSRSSYS